MNSMTQLGDIPLFRGDGLEDAEKWQQDFLLATAQYNDQAVARLFISKLANGCPASKYISTLPPSVRSSWLELDPIFQSKWVPVSGIDTDVGDLWDAFEGHVLTEEMIFQDLRNSDDSISFERRTTSWANDHLRLGRATGGTDESLIRLTKSLLPPFFRAFLSLQPKPNSFEGLCENIGQMSQDVLDVERERYQENRQRDERLSSIERRLEEISLKMDRILKSESNYSSNPGGLITESRDQSQVVIQELPIVSIDSNRAQQIKTPSRQNVDWAEGATESLVPSQWEKPVMSLTKNEQIMIAQRAIDNIMQCATDDHKFTGLTTGQDATAWSILAIHSGIAPCSKKRRLKVERAVSFYCPSGIVGVGVIGSDSILLQCALAILYGFRAFSKPDLLNGAISRWDYMSVSRVGCSHAGISATIDGIHRMLHEVDHSNWNGFRDLCGGVFVERKAETGVGSFQTTLFMTISAFLAGCTGEEEYLDAAILSADCIQAFMLDPKTNLVKDCVLDPQTHKIGEDSGISLYLTGVLLEGLSTLAFVTSDIRWSNLARNVANAVMGLTHWHEKNGILSPKNAPRLFDVTTSKGILIRGIRAAYECNASDPGFQSKARSYINVQFNALREFARKGDYYALNWLGPFEKPYVVAQMTALDVLVAAIAVNL